MASVDKALATQLENIQKRTGKSLEELKAIIDASGMDKHGQLVAMLKTDLGMGHGDANTVVHWARRQEETPGQSGQELDTLYVGKKAALKPIHERILKSLHQFGGFEVSPKKAYISYRRKKQFCMVGPATNTQVEVGLNVKGLESGERLKELPAGRMCNYKVRLSSAEEVDSELVCWLKSAFDASGPS